MMRFLRVFLGCFFGATAILAQSISETDLTQNLWLKNVALSFGGAYRALSDTNEAILINPAGLGFYEQKISLAGAYTWVGATDSNALSVSAIDAKTLPGIPLAVAYDRDHPTFGGSEITVQQISLATTAKIGNIFSSGLTLKGYLTSTSSPLVDGPDGVDVDVGFLLRPVPLVSLAFTIQNIFNGRQFEEFPLTMGFGAGLNLAPHARLSIDLTRDFQTPAVNKVNSYFGGELRVAEGMFLRGGFGLDRIRQNNFYSLGMALVGPKLGLNFAFSQRLNPSSNTFSAGLEFYVL